jgi:hypothetical protein
VRSCRTSRSFQTQRKSSSLPSLAVLLPDLRKAARLPEVLGLCRYRPAHFPLLKCPAPQVALGSTRKIDLFCRDVGSSLEQALVFLKREQIRFSLVGSNVQKFEFAAWRPTAGDEDKHPIPVENDFEEAESLWWLPRIAEVAKPWDLVWPEHMPANLHAFPDALVARVETKGGRLRTFDFNRDGRNRPHKWRFAAADDDFSQGKWNRAIGNRLALEFFDVSGPVTIELKRLSTDVFTDQLVLAPPPGGAGSVLEIEICNREPEFLFSEADARVLAMLPDADFEAYYDLCCLPPDPIADPKADLTRRVPHHKGPTFFGPIKNPCSPAEIRAERS